MSIEIPQLDEQTYDELVDRGRTLISSSAVEWTDFNPHDPGITILELLAWLTESHSYELDQITDSHREKYLQLLGVQPTPPQPASVFLDLSPADGQAGRLPAETPLRADGGSGTRTFETTHETTLTDGSLAAVVVDHEQGSETKTHANDTDGLQYRAFGDDPDPGSALALGFGVDPFSSVEELSLFVDFHDADLPHPAVDSPDPTADSSDPSAGSCDPVTFEPSVDLVWEYCRRYPTVDREAQWEPLTVTSDTTNSVYETGFVTLDCPETWEPTAWGSEDGGLFGHQPGLVWLRCRVDTAGYEIPPQLDAIELNVVEASHRRHRESTLDPATEGATGGSRRYRFDHAPVLSATVRVDGEPWSEVADFDASAPGDRHYVLDRQEGTVTFGDGRAGRRPPVDATVTTSSVSGGGTAGNVPETASWQFSDGDQPLGDARLAAVDVCPKAATTGGRPAESVDDALDRCKRDLRTPYRAVTESEYATIADRTPGVRIARTTVDLPVDAGSPVSVVVVPYAPPDVRRPAPSEGFQTAVQQQLDRHRLLTDRVRVAAPTYVGLDLSVSVTVTDRYDSGGEQSAIEMQLAAYLDPIYGFDGDGWPFGRSLTPAELRDQLTALPAVDHVDDLSVRTVGDATVGTDDTVRIDDHALFAIERLQVDATVRDGGDR